MQFLPLCWLKRYLEWSEHYPVLVTLLAHWEARTLSLRLVLLSYGWIVVVVIAAQLLRVCAHQRKVDGSNLHIWGKQFWKHCGCFFLIGEGFVRRRMSMFDIKPMLWRIICYFIMPREMAADGELYHNGCGVFVLLEMRLMMWSPYLKIFSMMAQPWSSMIKR